MKSPQILKQSINVGYNIVDKDFNALEDRFKFIEEQLEYLEKALAREENSIWALIIHCEDIGAALSKLFAPEPAALENLNDLSKDSRRLAFELDGAQKSEDFIAVVARCRAEVKEVLSTRNQLLYSKLKTLKSFTAAINCYIKQRRYALLDYSNCINTIESLEKNLNRLDSKNHVKLFAQKKRAEAYNCRYESFNSTLNKELPCFFILVGRVFRLAATVIYIGELKCYEIFSGNFCAKYQQFDGSQTQDIYTIKHETFLKQQDEVALLDSLFICKFRDNFLRELTADAAFSPKLATTPASAESLYCVALYDFVKVEKGDISFKAGELIKVLNHPGTSNNAWWTGEIDNRVGKFPANYVRWVNHS